MSVRDAIVVIIVFGMFFWTPSMSDHLLRKHKVKILGEVLVPIVMPIIAGVGFYKQDWEMGVFGLTALAGYLLGLWYVRNKKEKVASFSYYTLTAESARTTSPDLLVKAMNDCRSDSGAYLVAKPNSNDVLT